VVAVPDIWRGQCRRVPPPSPFNPSPLTLGAIAYLVLFLPDVTLGRWSRALRG